MMPRVTYALACKLGISSGYVTLELFQDGSIGSRELGMLQFLSEWDGLRIHGGMLDRGEE